MSFGMVDYAATDTKERASLWSQNPRVVSVALAVLEPVSPHSPHPSFTEGQIEVLTAGQLAKAHSCGAGMQRGSLSLSSHITQAWLHMASEVVTQPCHSELCSGPSSS